MGLIIRLAILTYIIYLVFNFLKSIAQRGQDPSHKKTNSSHTKKDPYKILEIHRTSSSDEITKAYKNLLAQYHPDKVEHLGPEIRDLALKKTQEISWAYNQIR